ncbi:MAG TPA: hypothetical protein VMU83_11740 [Hanamia sp.]|nr:hypothetical protein [Hanamia sp.]
MTYGRMGPSHRHCEAHVQTSNYNKLRAPKQFLQLEERFSFYDDACIFNLGDCHVAKNFFLKDKN